MLRRLLILAAGATVAAACQPNLGAPPSLITGTRILAIRAQPAESPPGTPVVYDALVVTPSGTLDTAKAADVGWSLCLSPKPLADNNVASDACLETNGQTIKERGPIVTAVTPANTCQLFGPDPPPTMNGQMLRPPDPDVTGGYYQPLRADLKDPLGGPPPYIVAFALERISCDLPNVPVDIAQQFRMEYTPNQNPTLLVVEAAWAPNMVTVSPAAGIPAGTAVHLRARWSADSAESYPVFDPVSRTLVMQRESLRVSWFTTAGAFDHDVTGRGETETETWADNVLTTPATPGKTMHLWAVLRDARGGIDFQAYDVPLTQAP
jgi:hypothetical protein